MKALAARYSTGMTDPEEDYTMPSFWSAAPDTHGFDVTIVQADE